MKINKDLLLFGSILILIFFSLYQCDSNRDLKDQAKIDEQNRLALTDSVRIIKNDLGEEISIKNVLIADKKELFSLNKDLANDLGKLEGKVKYISSIVTDIKNSEPIVITNTVKEYPDGLKELSWNYDKQFDENNSRKIEGSSKFVIDTTKKILKIVDKGTVITKDEMKIKLITGLTEIDGSYQIYVKTDYPGVKFDKIDGSVLDKEMFIKPKEPSVIMGPSISAGMALNPITLQLQPQISLGISYTLNANKYIRKIKKIFNP
jgi:hypothetical protein